MKLSSYIGVIVPGDVEQKVIAMIMVNKGRRPIYVTGWGASLKKDKGQKGKRAVRVLQTGLPIMLREKEDYIVYSKVFPFLNDR